MELGWMAVVLVGMTLAWHRAGKPTSVDRLLAMESQLAQWPAPEELLKSQDELLSRLQAMEDGGHSLPAIVGRANELTKDMLAMKGVLAELREQVQLLRTKNSLRAVGGASE